MNMETAYELSIPTSNPQPLRTFDGEIIYTGDNEPLNTPTGNADVKEITSNNKIIWERAIPIQKSGETPLSFRTTRAKPLLDWSITGNTKQDWTPSPEPTVGNNKLDNSKIEKSSTITNFVYTDSSVSFGSMTVGSTINSAEIKAEDTSYAFSFSGDTSKVSFALKCCDSSHTYLGDANKLFDEPNRAVMTLLANTTYIRLVITTTVQGNVSLTNLMMNKGNTVMTFEPFKYLPNTGACPVQGVGDKTRNLLNVDDSVWNGLYNGVQYSTSNDIVRINGISDGGYLKKQLVNLANNTYTLSIEITGTLNSNESHTFNLTVNGERFTLVFSKTGKYSINVTGEITEFYTIINRNFDGDIYCKIMLNEGSTALPYEPYGYKVPVVTRGKNLFDINKYYGSVATVSGNSVIGRVVDIHKVNINDCFEIGKTYTFSCNAECPVETTFIRLEAEQNGGFIRSNIIRSGESGFMSMTFTPTNDCVLRITYGSGSTGVATWSDIQLELGSTATEYEPYIEPKTSEIYLNSPLMADEVLDSTGKREVEFKKMVLTGDENWGRWGTRTYGITIKLNDLYNDTVANIRAYSTHFAANYTSWSKKGKAEIMCNLDFMILTFSDDISVEDAVAFLKSEYDAGHPVTVWYRLATPTSETVDVPAIPTLRGNSVIDIDTEVQPKNMDAVYLGKDGEYVLFTLDKSKLDGERVIK